MSGQPGNSYGYGQPPQGTGQPQGYQNNYGNQTNSAAGATYPGASNAFHTAYQQATAAKSFLDQQGISQPTDTQPIPRDPQQPGPPRDLPNPVPGSPAPNPGGDGLQTPFQQFPDGRQYRPPNFGLTPYYQPYKGLNDQIAGANQSFYGPGNPTTPQGDIGRWNQVPYADQRSMTPSPWPSLFGYQNTWGGPQGGSTPGYGSPPNMGPPPTPKSDPYQPPPQQPPQTGSPPTSAPPGGNVGAPPPGTPPVSDPGLLGSVRSGANFNPAQGQQNYQAMLQKFGQTGADQWATNNWDQGGSAGMEPAYANGGLLQAISASSPGGTGTAQTMQRNANIGGQNYSWSLDPSLHGKDNRAAIRDMRANRNNADWWAKNGAKLG